MRSALMFAIVLVVGGSTFGVLTWFFRRLRRIEEESWGVQPHDAMRTQAREAFARLKSIVWNR